MRSHTKNLGLFESITMTSENMDAKSLNFGGFNNGKSFPVYVYIVYNFIFSMKKNSLNILNPIYVQLLNLIKFDINCRN